ncbi:MAG: aspartate aminotransferase family protein [Acidobacteria bacterium]|nr:aspartate aminotransferase family protein [Acidobacteriota bacterium]MBV9144706.1 aspartate aminotransferase family protein [Acidobacteriota bacterium]
MAGNQKSRQASEQVRELGHAAVDWISRYIERAPSLPVLSPLDPRDVLASLPQHPPSDAEPFAAILRDLDEKILPGITHWQSPNYFAYFPANSSPPSVAGDLLSSGLGVQGMLWATSPACTELEIRMLDWLVEMLELPQHFLSSNSGGGVIQDSASSANLCAVLAGRERATNFDSNENGCDQGLTAYTSNQAHSSMEKAIKVAGIGRKNLRLIAVDENFRMKPEALAAAIREDKRAGGVPCFVGATVGTTSAMAIDPLEEIGAICGEHNIWLHVDAAMAGTAALCPELRYIHAGLDLADSYCFDCHKWMFTNFDCTCFYVRKRNELTEALTITPEYLRNAASSSGSVVDFRDWHVPLGRRFRALKLWCVIRSYGVDGLRAMVRHHVKLTQMFIEWLKSDARFEIVAPGSLNLVCFRLKGPDSATEALMQKLNASGRLFLSHTKLSGKFTLRLCVGQTYTEEEHVREAFELIQQHASELAMGAR